MTAVARRASCSKETLYKWFGDRDGLLAATVRWQASRVRAGNFDAQHLDALLLHELKHEHAQACGGTAHLKRGAREGADDNRQRENVPAAGAGAGSDHRFFVPEVNAPRP